MKNYTVSFKAYYKTVRDNTNEFYSTQVTAVDMKNAIELGFKKFLDDRVGDIHKLQGISAIQATSV